eukprot:gnl/Hemi2/23555_TR7905_c0_g1_i1.p1 gnl/Hemi2/23555_TR7905_c0_g1~~gnl/Hemi2/23555_TR7905_c0_g1_i1.p1  ORF type:complete len:321 (-),score=78.06 gnl/Hemi2/23555_TR7905_c0_g1_i1:58-1020(-)
MERTAELFSAAAALQNAALANGANKPSQMAANGKHNPKSQFALMASRIGSGIHATSVKLEKLTELARNKSPYNDPTNEISHLTQSIKQDMDHLKATIRELQQQAAQNKHASHQNNSHSKEVLASLDKSLSSAATDFKRALETRAENLKFQQERRKQFDSRGNKPSPADTFRRTPSAPRVDPNNWTPQRPTSIKNQAAATPNGDGFSIVIDPQNNSQQEQMQLTTLNHTDQYYSSRARTMETIQSTIQDLGKMFSDVQQLVVQQAEVTKRIEDNVLTASTHVDQGRDQLQQLWESVSSERGLILKIFFVLLVFSILFIVFT